MQQLIILRGLPGSGKSTLAEKIAGQKNAIICSTDDFWLCNDGEYRFESDRLKEAHEWCQNKARKALKEGKTVIIDNCNVLRAHMQPYEEMAENAEIVYLTSPLNDKDAEFLYYNSKHPVPLDKIKDMKRDWEE